MTTCTKCKTKIGIFQSSEVCQEEDCPARFCEKCAKTELATCEYCDSLYCKKCIPEHKVLCKEEYDSADEEDEVEEDEDTNEGITFNKAKTVCILDMSNYSVTDYVEELETLRNDFVYDEQYSNDDYWVYFKKS